MSWQSNFERVITNKAFEFFIIFVIMASALTVGAKTYDISPTALYLLNLADIGITVIFVIEISFRFQQKKKFVLGFIRWGKIYQKCYLVGICLALR